MSLFTLLLGLPGAFASVVHYPPSSTTINNLTFVLNGSGTPGIFNSSVTPDKEYGIYNWCNMPHVRQREYKCVCLWCWLDQWSDFTCIILGLPQGILNFSSSKWFSAIINARPMPRTHFSKKTWVGIASVLVPSQALLGKWCVVNKNMMGSKHTLQLAGEHHPGSSTSITMY